MFVKKYFLWFYFILFAFLFLKFEIAYPADTKVLELDFNNPYYKRKSRETLLEDFNIIVGENNSGKLLSY